MGYFRHPRTQQERRVNGERDLVDYDDYKIKIRAKRNKVNLPSLWDDVFVASRKDRSWKRFRKKQYK